ncbi:hypothetical protein [Adhaeribacter aquaticus]|uniref:hypothetical protein n=1 Tax=Adhaeribacter aquaticus TaxID=299567 RepID=UPI0004229D88|nr:hypothetical protein [Adhaeribacter aquaticus]
MSMHSEFSFDIRDIENYTLVETEEKLLYLRYLIRREQKDYKIIKYQYLLEHLEQHLQHLKFASKETDSNLNF